MRQRVLLPLLLFAVGCAGGLHRAGENQIAVHGTYGDPFRDSPVWGIGKGTASNAGLTVGYHRFFHDRAAGVVAVTPLRVFNQDGSDIYAFEWQLGLRGFPFEFSTGSVPTALYLEVLGGRLIADEPVPPAGTRDNWTQSFGAGLEWGFTERTGGFLGYRLRHISNGTGNVRGNPAQNEHQLVAGIAFRW